MSGIQVLTDATEVLDALEPLTKSPIPVLGPPSRLRLPMVEAVRLWSEEERRLVLGWTEGITQRRIDDPRELPQVLAPYLVIGDAALSDSASEAPEEPFDAADDNSTASGTGNATEATAGTESTASTDDAVPDVGPFVDETLAHLLDNDALRTAIAELGLSEWRFGIEPFTPVSRNDFDLKVGYSPSNCEITFAISSKTSKTPEKMVEQMIFDLRRVVRAIPPSLLGDPSLLTPRPLSPTDRTEIRSFPTDLTIEALLNNERTVKRIQQAVDRLKDDIKELQSEKKEEEARLKVMIENMGEGRPTIDVMCRWFYDYTNSIKELRRSDTGEIVETVAMTADEKQLQLSLDEDRHPDDKEGLPIPPAVEQCALALANAKYLIRDRFQQDIPDESTISLWTEEEIAEVMQFAQTVDEDSRRSAAEMIDPDAPEILQVWWDSIEVDESIEQGDIDEDVNDYDVDWDDEYESRAGGIE